MDTSLPALDADPDGYFNGLLALPQGKLEAEYRAQKAKGPLDPNLEGAFTSLLDDHIDKWYSKSAGAPASQLKEDVLAGEHDGTYSPDFVQMVAIPEIARRRKEEVEKGTFSTVKDAALGVVSHPIETLKSIGEMGKEMYQGGVDLLAATAQAYGATGGVELSPRDAAASQLEGGMKLANATDLAIRHTLVPLSRFAQLVGPGDTEAGRRMAEVAAKLTDNAVVQVGAENDALKSGDLAKWWDLYSAPDREMLRAATGEGNVAKSLGIDASSLASDGVRVSPEDVRQIKSAGSLLANGVQEAVPLSLGIKLGGKLASRTARVVLEHAGTGVAGKAVAAFEDIGSKLVGKAAPAVKLAKGLETKADEAARIAEEAARYNTILRRARMSAGAGTVELGNLIRKTAGRQGTGLAVAGLALANGADAQEAFAAGLAGYAGARLLGGKLGAKVVGGAMQAAGRAMQRELPGETIRRAMLDFAADYSPVRTALAGAGVGAVASLPWAIGSENTEEARGMIAAGAGFGAAGAVGARFRDFGAREILKARAAGGEVAMGPHAPEANLGLEAGLDATNAAAESQLSQNGLAVAKQGRALARSIGGEAVFVSDATSLRNEVLRVTGGKVDTGGSAQGIFIPGNENITGKPLVLSSIGADGRSTGHEIFHAMAAHADSTPGGKKAMDAVRARAAESLFGAKFENGVVTSSPTLDVFADYYNRLMGVQTPDPAVDPAGHQRMLRYAIDEALAEHGNAAFNRLPAGKLGGSRKVVGGLERVLSNLVDRVAGIKDAGVRPDSPVVTSDVLPFQPDFDLVTLLENSLYANALERSDIIPDASIEATGGEVPEPTAPAAGKAPEPTVPKPAAPPKVDVGVLNPVPRELTTDQSLGTTTPPPEQPLPRAAAPEVPAAEKAPVLRGPEVEAARTNLPTELDASEKSRVAEAQPNESLRPVAEQVFSYAKAQQGSRVGAPLLEVNYRDGTTGEVFSKRVAPYDLQLNKTDKGVTIVAFDVDRINHSAKLLFDWADQNGEPGRFGYKDVNDPQFVKDLQVYLGNHARNLRGGGGELRVGGAEPKPAGEAVGMLPREKEQFFAMLMGNTPPKEATPRSLDAINRIRATAKAGGVEPLELEGGSVEPNLLRQKLRREGAPVDRMAEDPHPSRVQGNTKDRNSVTMRMKLSGFESARPTGQRIDLPNTQASEASFMPAGEAGSVEKAKFDEFKNFFSNVTKGQFGKSDKPFIPELADRLNTPEMRRVVETRQSHAGNFDDHIQKSIPTFYEAQMGTIKALAGSLPAGSRVLDIAASEGSYGKTISQLSGGKIKTVSLDPNLDMARFFENKSKVEGAEYSTDAFGASFEEDGRVVAQHDPAEKYDAIHESMGFQFISPDREGQVAEVKRLLAPGGLFLTEQKLKNPRWAENERLKDTEHKNKYFSTEELAAKDRVVGFSSEKKGEAVTQSASEAKAVGMVANQVEQARLERVLKDNFKHVVQYWDAGNFKGYAASDSPQAVQRFISGLPDLNSKFSNEVTPREVTPTSSFMPASKRQASVADFSKDAVKDLPNKSGWAIFTAENPKSYKDRGIDATPEDNAARNEKLVADLERDGLEHVPVKGSYGKPENSFIVIDPDMTVDKAAALARKYDQDSVFTNKGLVYQDGSVNPLRGIQTFDTRPEDFYTEHDGHFFSGDIDFDTKIAPDSIEGQTMRAEEILDSAIGSSESRAMPGEPKHGAEEWVRSAALRSKKTGRVYEGKAHWEALEKAQGEKEDLADLEDGFSTNKGRFLGREESYKLAADAGQLDEEAYFDSQKRYSEEDGELPPAEPIKRLESYTFDDARRFMPSKRLENERVKGPDVQFKSKAKPGSKGGIIDVVHFSSQTLKEIDPKKSFGKGAATASDLQGEPKVFFYVKGTSYEHAIATRQNIYRAQIDGNSLYDYNADPLDVRSIANREKRDAAIRKAGFAGFYVETPGFDAVALFEKTKVKPALATDVMNRRQLVDTGREEATPKDLRDFAIADRKAEREAAAQEKALERAKNQIRKSPAYKAEAKRLVSEEGLDDFTWKFEERMRDWLDAEAEKRIQATDTKAAFMPAKKPSGIILREGDRNTLPVFQEVNSRGTPQVDEKGRKIPVKMEYRLLDGPELQKPTEKGLPVQVELPDWDSLAYDVPKPAREKIETYHASGALGAVARQIVDRVREYMKNPEIDAGKGWYSRMRVKLKQALGEGAELMSQLLGATSARTPVDTNFLQAMDAYEQATSGKFDTLKKNYAEYKEAFEAGRAKEFLEQAGWQERIRVRVDALSKQAAKEKDSVQKKRLKKEAKDYASLLKGSLEDATDARLFTIAAAALDLVPRQSNGRKFNANSFQVLRVLSGEWLDNRSAPKTPNFAGNLSGRTTQATIDVWAARFLRSVLYEKHGPWRIAPAAEVGVKNGDFALGQVLFKAAASELGMAPDDLQAVLWFAEKHRWEENGWTNAIGAGKTSFDTMFGKFFPDTGARRSHAEVSAEVKKAREALQAEQERAERESAEAEGLPLSKWRAKEKELAKTRAESEIAGESDTEDESD